MKKYIETIEMVLRNRSGDKQTVYIDVLDNSLSHRWLQALIQVLQNSLHLEKNYCFLGFAHGERAGEFLCDQINQSIAAINAAQLGYEIQDHFILDQMLPPGPAGDFLPGLQLDHDRLNRLHRYFEDLQGVSGALSPYYVKADGITRWHIRQLNLLCHELETWALSWRKANYVPEWARPSQLMCWLNAPRFELCHDDFDLFGIDSLYRDLGGVYVGVNKAVGKHHWEVFNDEGHDSRIDELTTSSLRTQTEAAADFDIEWAQNTRGHPWMKTKLVFFRNWLTQNGFDPDDKALTIGHPKVAQVDLERSFGTQDYRQIWRLLETHMDVLRISVAGVTATYDYHWSDPDYMQQQIKAPATS